jgi:uncharacterized protein (DUF1015 family)
MTRITGLSGLRPNPSAISGFTVPPYDVIKAGSTLESTLKANANSLWHITLGSDPMSALTRLKREILIEDAEPSFYVYEQCWTVAGTAHRRLGVFAAVAVSEYRTGQVIRHEKTFDDKVRGRLALTQQTGLTLEPVFLLTRSSITPVLEEALKTLPALYAFVSDFAGESELHNIRNRFVRVPLTHALGGQLTAWVGAHPLYIADGHHRYHAALLGGQTHCMAYLVERAHIQAYNRVINGVVPFSSIKDRLALKPAPRFATPAKHEFCIYTRGGAFTLAARQVPTDVVGRLDCSILERELYPMLGLNHEMIKDAKHFDYYPEQDLAGMQACVDRGTYDLAVALAPVSIDELVAVADAGLADGGKTVMPEKSTFFAPKILSGVMLYRHAYTAGAGDKI